MGSTSKKNAGKKFKGYKVTFTVEVKDGVRVYTPVNRRAKLVADVYGGKVTSRDLKEVKETGWRPYMWVGEGSAKKLYSIKLS